MTRIVFLTALTALVGCKKDECDDTAAGACDTGVEEVDADGAADADAGADADGSAPTEASCTFGGGIICIETTNADPAAWCATEGGTHADAACPDGADNTCDIPADGTDGTYGDAAMAYYYAFDGEQACTDVGGTYN